MQNLRTQLLISHLLLLLLMVGVMTGAVLNFFHLGRSIDRILKNNYKSVIAAQNMEETLERQDSAATFFLAGKSERARLQYEANWPLFRKAYEVEAHNITEPGEQAISDDVGRQFAAYRKAIAKLLYANPPFPAARANDYYFGTLAPAFLRLKQRVQDILDLNQKAIVRGDSQAKAEALRASWMSIAVTGISFFLALFVALRMINAALSPLRALALQTEEIGLGHLNQRIEVKRTDEIGLLASSFNRMAGKLREARRQLEERLRRAERMSDAALESLYDPVIVTDARGEIVHLNRAAEGLFGSAISVAHQPISKVVREQSVLEAVERAIRQERVSAAEGEAGLVSLQAGGSQRVYRLRASPMRESDETLLGAVLVLEDVTHVRELDRLKTEFIGVASHELRTPVTSLLLSVQLLDEGAAGPLTPDQKEIVKAQKEDLQRLAAMMRDLLELTRLEAGVTPPRLEIVPPHELVQGAIQSILPQAEAKGLPLNCNVPENLPCVRADREQITRVLVNLLSNAVRHTNRGSVSVEASESGGIVVFTIRDTGVGIPKEYLPRIFERFVQVPGATRGGAGLGLSIAQTIIRAHGGTMTAKSKFGEGSAFTFTLPTPDGNL
ncbi:MAG TPA: ATP-binding protein [Armatimonadota bacterium]|nr:ATP-binding protein [Armatimonadota bacterium]